MLRQMGRRQKRGKRGEGLRRELPLQVRVDAKEKATYTKAADVAGLSLSSWARLHLSSAARMEQRDREGRIEAKRDRERREIIAALLEERRERV